MHELELHELGRAAHLVMRTDSRSFGIIRPRYQHGVCAGSETTLIPHLSCKAPEMACCIKSMTRAQPL